MKKDCPPEVGVSVFDRLRSQLQKNGCHPYTWVSNPVEQYMIDLYNRASKAMVAHERPLFMAFWTSSWLLENDVSLLVGAPVWNSATIWRRTICTVRPLIWSCMIDFSLTGLELNLFDFWHHPYASVAFAHMLCPYRGLHETLANQAKCQPQQKPRTFFWWAACISFFQDINS